MLQGTINVNQNLFTLSLRQRKKKKTIGQKRIALECCCLPNRRLRPTSSKTNTLRWIIGNLAVYASYHKGQTLPPASGTTHMLRGTIRINRNVFSFSLCEKEKSKKPFFECCCLPNRRLQLKSSKTNALRWVIGILAVVASYHKGQTLPPASGTTHMLRGTIRINRNVFSLSLCEKEKRKKPFFECCCLPNRRLQLTSSKTNALRWVTGILAVVASYHKGQTLPPASGTTHMLRGTIRINRNVLSFSLCEKEKRNFWNVVACRIIVCDRRPARQTRCVE
jgi:hypothetical protein